MGKAIESPLTVEQVAALLQISEKTVYRLLNAETLRGYKVAALWRVDREAVAEYLDDCRAKSERPVVYQPKLVVYQGPKQGSRVQQSTRQLPPALSKTGHLRGGATRG